MDAWHLVEILALAMAGIAAWLYRDLAEKVHKLTGRTDLLATGHARSEERDIRFEKSIDRLEKVIDHLAAVLEQGSGREVRRRLSPPEGTRKPIPREEP